MKFVEMAHHSISPRFLHSRLPVFALALALVILPLIASAAKVQLPADVPFPVIVDGQKSGEAVVPAGTVVTVLDRQGDQVTIQYRNFRTVVPISLFQPDEKAAEKPDTAPKTPAERTGVGALEGDLGFAGHIKPILEQHCTACHGASEQKGGVELHKFTDAISILEERDMWLRAFDAVDFEEMPPNPEKTGFTDQHRQVLMDWIQTKVEPVDENSPIYLDPGPSLLRQLTAKEYQRSIKELLGIDFDIGNAVGLHDEYVEYTFTNNAAANDLDATTLEKYMDAAKEVLAQLYGDTTASWYSPRPRDKGENNRRLQESKQARETLFAPAEEMEPRQAAAQILEDLATRAYRRPVAESEIAPMLALFDSATAHGDDFETAMRKCMKPILASPKFLFRIENKAVPSRDGFARINDFELATRLSYFLWASLPDNELLELAQAGKLSDPTVLQAQVDRMLKDDRARALTDIFALQWLQLHHMEIALPSARDFPLFKDDVPKSMKEEVLTFFDHLRTEDRPVLDLIHADYTFANASLAKIYGLKGVKGKELQKVSLKPEDHRGGLLGMGAILAMTSHTDRTKPTARGKWILDVIYGTPPPPPPANVESLEDQDKKKDTGPLTFREKLEMHASDPACKTCHNKLDPLGFALENYNAIGQWRDEEKGKPVDNSGVLPSGQKIKGINDLKEVLWEQREKFAANVVRQLMSYALGREIKFTDELAITQITEAAASNDYRFSDIIQGIVASRPFQYKRVETNAPPVAALSQPHHD